MRKINTIVVILIVVLLTSCGKNYPNCPEGYIQSGESCIELDINDQLDFERDISRYDMDVYVDDIERTMTVEGSLIYRNDKLDMETLYVMLYANATPYRGETNASFEYLKIDGEDVIYEYSDTDDEIIEITPNEVLEEGTYFELEFKYTFHFWIQGRLTLLGEYLNAMFFYPVIAQYDGEWHLDTHSFTGEAMYTDVADFTVTINIDEDYIIASGGALLDTFNEAGRTIETYELLRGRDYSFSASTEYVVYEKEHRGITHYIYTRIPLTETEQDYHFGYMFDTFDYLEDHVGPYYYDYFKLELGEIYGMESSSIIYCSESIGEITIIHEIVHQWFFFMIGNNQAEESWLDEGMTSYVTGIIFEEIFGSSAAEEWYYSRYDAMNGFNSERFEMSIGDPVIQHVDDYDDYGYVVYRYGSSVLYQFVEQFLDGNHDAFFDILEVYYDTYQGDNASIETFLNLIVLETENPDTKLWIEDKLEAVKVLSE